MFIDTPQNVVSLPSRLDGDIGDGTHYLLCMKLDTSKFYFDNRRAMPTAENYIDAAEYLTDLTEVQFSAEQAADLLMLYPQVRIKIAVYDGIDDTDGRDGLDFAAAHFFLGCSWPTFGDEVDVAAFVSMLKKQATQLGFKTATVKA